MEASKTPYYEFESMCQPEDEYKSDACMVQTLFYGNEV